MNILLDTHAFLWLRTAPDKIPSRLLSAYDDLDNEFFLSIASVWEIQIKQQLGKLELDLSLPELIKEQRLNNGLQLLAIETEHIFALSSLPFHHKDPFDRLILVQSQIESLKLASADTAFTAYGVELFW